MTTLFFEVRETIKFRCKVTTCFSKCVPTCNKPNVRRRSTVEDDDDEEDDEAHLIEFKMTIFADTDQG